MLCTFPTSKNSATSTHVTFKVAFAVDAFFIANRAFNEVINVLICVILNARSHTQTQTNACTNGQTNGRTSVLTVKKIGGQGERVALRRDAKRYARQRFFPSVENMEISRKSRFVMALLGNSPSEPSQRRTRFPNKWLAEILVEAL